MASIPASQARGLFTQALIDAYRERTRVFSFFRSFFPTVESLTRYISIEVQRNGEPIAVDVRRGSEGNRNSWPKNTEKIFEPPYYKEFFDVTDLTLYDRLFGSADSIESGVFTMLLQEVMEHLDMLVAKIERRYELQCAQVLETGIVTVNEGINIDFKRKAESKVDAASAGGYWSSNSVNPETLLIQGAEFLRTKGKAQGGIFNVILGSRALSALKNNDIFQKQSDIKNFDLNMLQAPQRQATGYTVHGMVSAGNWGMRLFGYGEYYTDREGVDQPYMPENKIFMLPETPRFRMGFAAVPQLIDEMNPAPQKGAYVFYEATDQDREAKKYGVKSAGLAIPVAVDQIFTAQVVADEESGS